MIVLNNVRIAIRSLRLNKLRSTLTMLGIILGVGSVIAVIALGAGTQARFAEEMKTIGTNLILIQPGSAKSQGIRRGAGTNLTLTDADAIAIKAEIPAVRGASPSLKGNGQIIYGNANWNTMGLGVTPEYHVVRNWSVSDGRQIDQEDYEGYRKVAVIGQTVVEKLFGGRDPIGQIIRIDRVPLEVVGILSRKGQSMAGQDLDDLVLVPLSTVRTRLLGNNRVNAGSVSGITVKLQDGASIPETMQHIRETLRDRHRLQPWQDDDFQLKNLDEVFKAQEATSRIMTLFLVAIASVSLIVGGVGIMNIMLVSVTERTREIGLRVALGARDIDIMTQFLTEAVTLSLVGGLIGVGVGITGSVVIGEFGGFMIAINSLAIVIALVFALLIGVVFGFLPARKAARLDPVEALRYE